MKTMFFELLFVVVIGMGVRGVAGAGESCNTNARYKTSQAVYVPATSREATPGSFEDISPWELAYAPSFVWEIRD